MRFLYEARLFGTPQITMRLTQPTTPRVWCFSCQNLAKLEVAVLQGWMEGHEVLKDRNRPCRMQRRPHEYEARVR